ncbi:MAG: hypothetical protein ACJA2Q_001818 [Pseudohongiellaceae bacterium]|jgi:hypothetical protein
MIKSMSNIVVRGIDTSAPKLTPVFGLLVATLSALYSQMLPAAVNPAAEMLVGHWVINEELSDNTDKQVEAAIKEAGGKVKKRWFAKAEDDFYRGGPDEQELYDRISYDDVLTISIEGVQCRFEYADNFTRVFHTDGRKRQSSANTFYSEGGADFSLSRWESQNLIVEARPRDGGFTLETYSLSDHGNTLTIAMQIEPSSFGAAINLVRVFNRASSASSNGSSNR